MVIPLAPLNYIPQCTSEPSPKFYPNPSNPHSYVLNLGRLLYKGLRVFVNMLKSISAVKFPELRKLPLDSLQGKGLKWGSRFP